jgi:peptide/nickel transport system substrate-binding protein
MQNLLPLTARFINLSLLVVLAASLTGCKPDLKPVPFVDRHPIKRIDSQAPQAAVPVYTSRTVYGVDYRVSPYPQGQFGGALVASMFGDGPKTFNAWASYDATSTQVGAMLTAGLLDANAHTGEVVPLLAKAFNISPDGKTITVTLRQGLRWSDGKPITVKDVLFTWNTILAQGLGNPSSRDVLLIDGKFPKVWAKDDKTVMFQTPRPFAPFLRLLGSPIAPAHVFEPVLKKEGPKGFNVLWNSQQAVEHPEQLVSGGMWVLHAYVPGEKIIFRPNPHFWMINQQGQRLPYIKQLVYRIVKDQNSQALQFEQGNLDDYAIAGKDLTHVRQLKHPDFTIYNLGPNTGTTFLAFNLLKRLQTNGKPVVEPLVSSWFHVKAFRQAVDWAVDREALVRNVLKGVGAPLFTAESLASIYVHPQLKDGHPRHLDEARRLLKSAGFNWDATGKLLDAQGKHVRFSLMTNSGNEEREAAGVSVKQDLEDLGMTVDFKPLEFNVLVGKLKDTNDWQMVLISLTGDALEPNNGANVWRSNGGLHMFYQRDVEKLGNRLPTDRLPMEVTLDALLDKGTASLDVDKRRQVYNQMQALLYEEQPMVYLYSGLRMAAVRNRVQNLDPTQLQGTFHNLESLWVKE